MGPNYLHLPVNAPQVKVTTNQRDGIMSHRIDGGDNPNVNYEPSTLPGTAEEAPENVRDQEPHIEGNVGRFPFRRTESDYKQAGERYRAIDERERTHLIGNLVDALKQCDPHIQLRMVWHFLNADENYGTRVADGIGVDVAEARKLQPLPGKPVPGQPRTQSGDGAVASNRTPDGQPADAASRQPATAT